MPKADTALIFDLDGTLLDNVYLHVMAWSEALRNANIELSTWRIHRKIGMSGGLFVRALTREIGRELDEPTIAALRRDHNEAYLRRVGEVMPLPGAKDLLKTLTREKIPWAIATSGERAPAEKALHQLEVPDGVPIITRDEVEHAKPNPDLFLKAAEALKIHAREAFVVGDSIWDMLGAGRAGSLGVGLLCGGYGQAELVESGAYRVYADPGDLLLHLDELGVRTA